MGTSSLAVILALVASNVGASIAQDELDGQNKIFQRWFGTSLVWKFDELPEKGEVPEFRVPYSGYIYPDAAGGTARALRKYDMAFNGGRLLATGHEQWDTSAFQEQTMAPQRVGLFGLRVRMTPTMRTPGWHGHCNGWTAAAIRHAEPERDVVRHGVTFTRADIKALLAEIYMYSHYESLAGEDTSVNAGLLHVILANWVGRQSHPLAMEAMPGREKWNFPIYSFSSSSVRRGDRAVDVELKIVYAYYSNGEYERSPRLARQKYFHYSLSLNEQGEIVGGSYYRNSSIIDLLWAPLKPVPGGQEGNERGNPNVDVHEVISLWRESVSEEVTQKWINIDPD